MSSITFEGNFLSNVLSRSSKNAYFSLEEHFSDDKSKDLSILANNSLSSAGIPIKQNLYLIQGHNHLFLFSYGIITQNF